MTTPFIFPAEPIEYPSYYTNTGKSNKNKIYSNMSNIFRFISFAFSFENFN